MLRCLPEGDGDNPVASRLGINGLTVDVQTKAILRHCRVQGRAELLARWIRLGRGARFIWAL